MDENMLRIQLCAEPNIQERFVLGLSRVELTLFRAAPMVLCFAAVSRTELVTHQCFGCCGAVLAQLEGFLSSILPPPRKASRLELGKKLGGDAAGTAEPN